MTWTQHVDVTGFRCLRCGDASVYACVSVDVVALGIRGGRIGMYFPGDDLDRAAALFGLPPVPAAAIAWLDE